MFKLYLNYNLPFGRLSSSLLSSGSLPSEGVAEVALCVGVAGCWCPSGAGTRLVCCEAHLASVGTLSGCVVKRLESASVPAWRRWNESVLYTVYLFMTVDTFCGIPALLISK